MKRVVLLADPGRDPDPELTASRDVELGFGWSDQPAAVVGYLDRGVEAVALAAGQGEAVDRLVLISAPISEQVAGVAASISAKTLLLFGTADAKTGSAAARWWKARIPNSRIEMVPGSQRELLPEMWPRVLAHCAPRPRPRP